MTVIANCLQSIREFKCQVFITNSVFEKFLQCFQKCEAKAYFQIFHEASDSFVSDVVRFVVGDVVRVVVGDVVGLIV